MLRVCSMFLGPAPEGFAFIPKHKAKSWDDKAGGGDEKQTVEG